jgi:uncharacterized protein HemY
MKDYQFEKAKTYFKMAIDLDPENRNAAEMYDYL